MSSGCGILKFMKIFVKHRQAIITAVIFGIYVILACIFTGGICVVRAVAGLPCPACGITRAFLSLFAFDLRGAFTAHPLFLLAPVSLAFIVYNAKIKPVPARVYRVFLWSCAGAFIALYIVRMVLLFPHSEPMTINGQSLLMRIIGG
jgi:hypothetical protein